MNGNTFAVGNHGLILSAVQYSRFVIPFVVSGLCVQPFWFSGGFAALDAHLRLERQLSAESTEIPFDG